MSSNVTVTSEGAKFLHQTNTVGTVLKRRLKYSESINLTVVAGTEYKEGTVLGFNATTGKYVITDSGDAATNNARAVLAQYISADNTSTDLKVAICIEGDVDEDLLIFKNVTDTLNTVAGSGSDTYRTELINNDIVPEKYSTIG